MSEKLDVCEKCGGRRDGLGDSRNGCCCDRRTAPKEGE